mgnify:CR=1 FL=1
MTTLPRPLTRPLLIGLLTFLSLCLVGLLAALTDSWSFLRVPQAFDSRFVDLQYLTATAECFRNDPNWTLASATCDPFGRLNNYPSPWLLLIAFVGVNYEWTFSLAITYIFLFGLSVGFITFVSARDTERPWLVGSATCITAFAPPTWLMLERGSTEVVIFGLVTLALFSFMTNRRSISALLLALAATLKFFPAGASISLLQGWPKGRRAFVLFVAGSLFGLLLISGDLKLIAERTPQPDYAAFGASILPKLAGMPGARFIGIILFLVMALAFIVVLTTNPFANLRRDFLTAARYTRGNKTTAALIMFGGGPLLAAYILGTNYDYRFIYAIPVVAGLTRIQGSRSAMVMSLLFIASAMGTYAAPDLLEVSMDITLIVAMPILGWLTLAAAGLSLGRVIARIRCGLLKVRHNA